MADIDKVVGANVAAFRGSRSQADLARIMSEEHKIKWSQTTVWEIEKGKRALKFSEALALADTFHIPVGSLRDAAPGPSFLFRASGLWEERNTQVRQIMDLLTKFQYAQDKLWKLSNDMSEEIEKNPSSGLTQDDVKRVRKLATATLAEAIQEVAAMESKRGEHASKWMSGMAEEADHLLKGVGRNET